ncbi:hypothetical protein Trydic_g14281 [Trypoxylus dichotomus]
MQLCPSEGKRAPVYSSRHVGKRQIAFCSPTIRICGPMIRELLRNLSERRRTSRLSVWYEINLSLGDLGGPRTKGIAPRIERDERRMMKSVTEMAVSGELTR